MNNFQQLGGKKFFVETLYNHLGAMYEVEELLFHEKVQYQDIVIFKNKSLGTILALDGIIQVTTNDEAPYHEMLSHVPILSKEDVSDVLIIGGGDGGIAREVLKHKNIKVTMVELEETITNLCKKYMPSISDGAFDNPNLEVVFGDGAKFVKDVKKKYDVIIVDSTDPIGKAKVLFGRNFYQNCHNILKDGGIVVSQQGELTFQKQEILDLKHNNKGIFNNFTCYLTNVATYFGAQMALGFSTDNANLADVPLEIIKKRYSICELNTKYFNTKYYTPEIHRASFALPHDISKLIKNA